MKISVRVENRPTEQYDQVDLVWYYDGGDLVKLGQELVDGKLSIVMDVWKQIGREQLLLSQSRHFQVQLRFSSKGDQSMEHFRLPNSEE